MLVAKTCYLETFARRQIIFVILGIQDLCLIYRTLFAESESESE